METPARAPADKKSKRLQMEAERDFSEFTGRQTPTATRTDMNPAIDFLQSAPVLSPSEPDLLKEAVERAKTLVDKILRDVSIVHTATVKMEGLTLDSGHPTNLQTMVTSLGIPPAPVLKPLSEHFTLEVCVGRMSLGSRLYQRLLGVLSDRVSGLSDLQADLRDLQTHVGKMREVAQLRDLQLDENQNLDLASRLHGNYQVQIATHLTLTHLRSFCHDLIRSLRAVAIYKLHPAGTE
ncbi:colony stimulating factor 3 (granulocyte) b isoform 2-T2 [Spinachia spinachia]